MIQNQRKYLSLICMFVFLMIGIIHANETSKPELVSDNYIIKRDTFSEGTIIAESDHYSVWSLLSEESQVGSYSSDHYLVQSGFRYEPPSAPVVPVWQASLHGIGKDLGATNEAKVTIGSAQSYSVVSIPPDVPEFTLKMFLQSNSLKGPYSSILYPESYEQFIWFLTVDAYGNYASTDSSRTAVISWQPDELYAKPGWIFRILDENRNVIVDNMKNTSSFEVTSEKFNKEKMYIIEYDTNVTYTMSMPKGWSLFSLPLLIDDPISSIFPEETVIFKFDNGYKQVFDYLEPYTGYWVKLKSAQDITFKGKAFYSYNKELSKGWNLMGGISGSCRPKTEPPGCIESIFGFNRMYYRTTEFVQGQGYWVKISNECDSCQFICEAD